MFKNNNTGLIIYRGVFVLVIAGAIFGLYDTIIEQIRMREQVNAIVVLLKSRINDQEELQKQIKDLELRILTMEYDMYRQKYYLYLRGEDYGD